MLELSPEEVLAAILEYVGEGEEFSVGDCMEWVERQGIETDEGEARECLWVMAQQGTLGRRLVGGEFYRYWVVHT